jgi:hypothetical protein
MFRTQHKEYMMSNKNLRNLIKKLKPLRAKKENHQQLKNQSSKEISLIHLKKRRKEN